MLIISVFPVRDSQREDLEASRGWRFATLTLVEEHARLLKFCDHHPD
jgi:hypothetical protein